MDDEFFAATGFVKQLIIDSLQLEDLTPADIDTDAPLFVDGLGLDSIDALELVVTLGLNVDGHWVVLRGVLRVHAEGQQLIGDGHVVFARGGNPVRGRVAGAGEGDGDRAA